MQAGTGKPPGNGTGKGTGKEGLLSKVLIACAIEFPMFALLLFGAAGTIAWTAGWIWLGIMVAVTFPMVIFLYKHKPDLLRERLRPPIQESQKGWDKVLLPIFLTVFMVWIPLMPLDAVRFQWSHMATWLALPGSAIVVASMLFICWCFLENSYLAPVVKIQTDRGHHVVSTGPYAIIRHPMYAGALFFLPGTALLFGSWWGLGVCIILNAILAVRTALEDRTLHEELPGYPDYATKVRYRLLPGIW